MHRLLLGHVCEMKIDLLFTQALLLLDFKWNLKRNDQPWKDYIILNLQTVIENEMHTNQGYSQLNIRMMTSLIFSELTSYI